MRYFMMLDEKKEYAEEVTKELQEEIGILHDENSMLLDENTSLHDENNSLHDENNTLQDENNSLCAENKNLSARLTSSNLFIISLCKQQNMTQEETIACLETEMQMSHKEAVEIVHGHWN